MKKTIDKKKGPFYPARRLAWLAAGIFLLVAGRVQADIQTGADFLKIPIGSRITGLGGAGTAASTDVDGLNWNPAAIQVPNQSMPNRLAAFSFTHEIIFEENNLDNFGVIVPMGGQTLGLNVLRLSYQTQETRLADRTVVGSFTPSDTMMGLSLASKAGPFQLGTSVKWISQSLSDQQAKGMAFDFGILSPTPMKQLTLGASVKNLGPQLQMIGEKYYLPLTYSAGGVFKIKAPFLVTMDIVSLPYQHQTSLAFGTELLTGSIVDLRAGYLMQLANSVINTQQSETNRGNVGGISGFSGGLGLRFDTFRLDYAFTPFGELGTNQSLTLSAYFGSHSDSDKKSNGHQPAILFPESKSENVPSSLNEERRIVIFKIN